MNINTDFNIIVKKIVPFLTIILLALITALVFQALLPQYNLKEVTVKQYPIEYNKYKFTKTAEKEQKALDSEEVKEEKKEYALMSNISLKMIYEESNNNGWIIISEKSVNKNIILGIDEEFKNYKLKEIYSQYVVFTRNNKSYKLELKKVKSEISYVNEAVNNETSQITKVDDQYQLKRDLINTYTKNNSKIWKEISIQEIKKDGKIDGFEVKKLANKTVFKELGLQKGDVIKSVNNIKLKSYADAFAIYKKIDKTENLSIIIVRDNKEVELEYEIK